MDILENPFWTLGATLRDDRRRLMELAQEKSLLADEGAVSSASGVLTNPRKRLNAEVAWFPGLGLKRISKLIDQLRSDSIEVLDEANVPALARANLLAAGLKSVTGKIDKDDISKWIIEMADAFEGVDPEDVLSLINEEREVSGFPEVTDRHALESEIDSRRQHYRTIIRDALNQLSSAELIGVITEIVESATDLGDMHAALLIDDVVDTYEVEAQDFLDTEEQNIDDLLGRIQTEADDGAPEGSLATIVDELISVVKNWDLVAQPIQVSTKSRGLGHDASNRVARKVRDVVIDLYNTHERFDLSQKMNSMLQEVFAEVVDVAYRAEQDAFTLEKNAEQRTFYDNLAPMSSAPNLSTINGFGFALYGATDFLYEPSAEGRVNLLDRSHIATYYFTALAIPVFPIARYRVIQNGNSYRFLGEAPLRVFDKIHLVISIGLIITAFLAAQ